MIILKIVVAIICSGLFWYGGHNFLPARRFIMPTILALTCFFITHSWWCLTMLSAMGCLCLGYGDKSPLRHIFGNGWGRGVWGILVALSLSLALFLCGFVPLWLWLGYLALNFTLENALKNFIPIIGDSIIGLGFSLIIFIC